MSRRLTSPLSALLSLAIAALALGAGYQFGGGRIPYAPAVPDEMLYAAAAGLLGLGLFGTLLRSPDLLGRVAPTVYVVVALLPLLRFTIPAIGIIRFVPLALLAPAVYLLFREGEADPRQQLIARLATFAAFATAAASLIANRPDTDLFRLILMVGGIVLLVGAAPRAWGRDWQESVAKAVGVVFVALVLTSVLSIPFEDSYVDERLRGVFTSPNALGALLAITTPLAASRTRFSLAAWGSALALVIMTGTRAGLLALAVGAVVGMVKQRQYRRLAALGTLGLIGLAAGYVRVSSDQDAVRGGRNTRDVIWEEVAPAIGDSWITGHGFGSFADFEFSQQAQIWVGTSPETHNSWLDASYEQGLLGLVPWVLLLIVGLRTSFRVGPFWSATIIAGLVSATFESWLFAIGGGIGSLFWMVFGASAISAHSQLGRLDEAADPAIPEISSPAEVTVDSLQDA